MESLISWEISLKMYQNTLDLCLKTLSSVFTAVFSDIWVWFLSPQSQGADVQDTSTALTASSPTTRVPPSRVPTDGCVYPSLKVTSATAL